jgi:hypothetical protein
VKLDEEAIARFRTAQRTIS